MLNIDVDCNPPPKKKKKKTAIKDSTPLDYKPTQERNQGLPGHLHPQCLSTHTKVDRETSRSEYCHC